MCFVFVGRVYAQQTTTASAFPYIRNQMSVSVSYSDMTMELFHPNIVKGNLIKGCDIRVLYGVNLWLEVGMMVDISFSNRNMMRFPDPDLPIFHEMFAYISVCQGYLGNAAKIHLLPLFWPSFSVLDIYVSSMVGGYCGYIPMWSYAHVGFKAQLGAGANINLSRHFGLSFEYGIDNRANTYMLGGINIRFGGPKKWAKDK